jgi:hypothetical protein
MKIHFPQITKNISVGAYPTLAEAALVIGEAACAHFLKLGLAKITNKLKWARDAKGQNWYAKQLEKVSVKRALEVAAEETAGRAQGLLILLQLWLLVSWLVPFINCYLARSVRHGTKRERSIRPWRYLVMTVAGHLLTAVASLHPQSPGPRSPFQIFLLASCALAVLPAVLPACLTSGCSQT